MGGVGGEMPALGAPLCCPDNQVRRDVYKSTWKMKALNMLRNFMNCHDVSFIFHSTFVFLKS